MIVKVKGGYQGGFARGKEHGRAVQDASGSGEAAAAGGVLQAQEGLSSAGLRFLHRAEENWMG
jgi:hypothetical protein